MRWGGLLLIALAALPAVEDDDYAALGRAGFGAFLVPVPLEIQADLDLQPGQALMAVRVRPNSTAAGMGVQPGDVVLELNGQPIQSRRDLRMVIGTVSPGQDAMLVKAELDGRTAEVTGTFQERPQRRGPGGQSPRPAGTGQRRPNMPRWPSEEAVADAQWQRLADEAERYRELAAQIARLNSRWQQLEAAAPPWRMVFACDAPVQVQGGEEAAPLASEPIETVAAPATTPPWRFQAAVALPGAHR
jgi:hypothetical protein